MYNIVLRTKVDLEERRHIWINHHFNIKSGGGSDDVSTSPVDFAICRRRTSKEENKDLTYKEYPIVLFFCIEQ